MPSSITVIYQDPYLLVLEKPTCIHSVSLNKNKQDSVASFLSQNFPETVLASKKEEDSGLIQRLDYETSGLIIAARSRETWEILFESLKAGEIKKEYLVVLDGKLKAKQEISGYLGGAYRRSKKVKFYSKQKPRTLFSHSVFEPVGLWQKKYSLASVLASPARRHQVRVHAAELGLPLLGDELYGSELELEMKEYQASFFLNAWKIKLKHPVTGKNLEFKSSVTLLG